MVYLGIDYGDARTGVAVSVSGTSMAIPVETIASKRTLEVVQRVLELMEERGADCVVVGMPVSMDGTRGRAARRVERFVAALEKAMQERGIKGILHTWDERRTTVEAETMLARASIKRSKRKAVVDQVAATVILEGFLRSLP
ncbi:MAG: Holliday junction resolvase RuvX [Myxococcota bacterium]